MAAAVLSNCKGVSLYACQPHAPLLRGRGRQREADTYYYVPRGTGTEICRGGREEKIVPIWARAPRYIPGQQGPRLTASHSAAGHRAAVYVLLLATLRVTA